MVCLSLMLVAYLMLKRYKIEALFFVITMSLSSILNPLLKNIFDRERPTLLRLIDISGFSFPSGHAMGSTSFFGSAMYIAQRRNIRKYKRRHYWTMCGTYFTHFYFKSLFRRALSN